MFRKHADKLGKYAGKLREAGQTALAAVKGRQFLVTTVTAVVMLAALVSFWNYFILPREDLGEPQVVVESAGQEDNQRDTVAGAVNSGGESAPAGERETPVKGEKAPSPGEAALPGEPDPYAMGQPLEGRVVRAFGFSYSPTFDDYRYHGGIDIAAPEGTPVTAVLDGIVEGVTFSELEGYRVVIKHGGGWQSAYSHLSTVEVEGGEGIKAGSFIGRVGVPGKGEAAIGYHLHLEILKEGKPVDPLAFLNYRKVAGSG